MPALDRWIAVLPGRTRSPRTVFPRDRGVPAQRPKAVSWLARAPVARDSARNQRWIYRTDQNRLFLARARRVAQDFGFQGRFQGSGRSQWNRVHSRISQVNGFSLRSMGIFEARTSVRFLIYEIGNSLTDSMTRDQNFGFMNTAR